MDKRYLGTTVNERLFLSGLIGEFDEAVRVKDYEKIKEILIEVELSEESIQQILDGLDNGKV